MLEGIVTSRRKRISKNIYCHRTKLLLSLVKSVIRVYAAGAMIRITMTADLEYASVHCVRNGELFSRMTQGPPVSLPLDGFQPLEGFFLPLARSPAHLEPVFSSGILSLSFSFSLFSSSQERRRSLEAPRTFSTMGSDFRGHISSAKLPPFLRKFRRSRLKYLLCGEG